MPTAAPHLWTAANADSSASESTSFSSETFLPSFSRTDLSFDLRIRHPGAGQQLPVLVRPGLHLDLEHRVRADIIKGLRADLPERPRLDRHCLKLGAAGERFPHLL